MNIFKTSIKLSITFVILICIVFAIIIVSILFFSGDHQSALGTVLGSLLAGLIVALIQFLIAWEDYQQTEKLKKLQLIKIMYNRDERKFYESYIKNSKEEIKMMGVTAKRFFDDFADISQNAPSNAKVLLDALSSGVKVRILLPKPEYIAKNKANDVDYVKQKASALKGYNQDYNLEVKYFSHIPAHSIFCVDDECIVGPVFLEIESKYTPALHLKNKSPFAEKYLRYFDTEWNNAEVNE